MIGAKRGSPILISGKEMSANESSHNSIAVTGGGSPSPQMERGERETSRFPYVCAPTSIYVSLSPFLSLARRQPPCGGREKWFLDIGEWVFCLCCWLLYIICLSAT